MPHLTIRNVSEEALMERSGELADALAKAVGCERSWVTLDYLPSRRVQDGARVEGQPLVEVLWYRRPEEIKRAVAAILSATLRGNADFVTVVFRDLEGDEYWENGEML